MDFDASNETITPISTSYLTVAGTGGIYLPGGTTAERPATPFNGTIRYNTDLDVLEGYINSTWDVMPGTGSVTSISGSGGSTGLTLSGGPITTSGTLTLGGTLATSNGGTGVTSTPANGQLLIGNGSGYSLNTITGGTGITVVPSSGNIALLTFDVPLASLSVGDGLSVIGRFPNSTGPLSYITASSDDTVMRRNGSNIGWGSIDLSATNTVGTSVLSLANGGTNAALTPVNGGVAYSSGSALALTAAGTNGQVLVSTGAGAPSWSSLGAGSASKVMNTWTLLSGDLYYNDFTHNLNTTQLTVYIRDTSSDQEVRAEYTEIINVNTLRVVVSGNTHDITTNVVSGAGVVGPQGPAGSGSTIIVQDEGAPLATNATTLNFVGSGVVASGSGTTKTISINASSEITVQDEGTPLATAATTLNFVGAGVVASGTGSTKTITVDGGGGATIPTSNLTGTGTVVTGTVATNTVGVGATLYMAASGSFEMANASSGTTVPCRALALETGTGSKEVLLYGFVRNDSWSWTPGADIYVSTSNGVMTQTLPNGSSNRVQKIGFAWSADIIYFNPGDYTIITVA